MPHDYTNEDWEEYFRELQKKEREERAYKPITMEELLGEARERGEIIEEILGEREWGIIIGFPKQGKTFLALQLAYSLAEGKPFLGFPTKGRYRVLFISLEEDTAGIKSKLTALGFSPSPFLSFLFPPTMTLAHLKDIIKEEKYDVVIIDNLEMAWLSFIEEGMPTYGLGSAYEVEYKRLAVWKEIFSDLPISVIFTHHLNKQGLYLGTTAIKGFFDTIMEMTPRLREGNKQVCLIELSARARKGKEFIIGREGAEWEYEGEAQASQKEKAKVLILALFDEERREWKTGEIVEALEEEGIAENIVNKALKELVERGSLERLKRGVYRRPSMMDIHIYNEEKKEERKLEGME
jgi:NOL1/NOP2/fmu family ribosome biogenesis protein